MLSYAVYIGILIFYFCFIYFMFPETKRLSAEDASRVFDYNRKGLPFDKSVDDVEQIVVSPDMEKKETESAIEGKDRT
jgi:hypothetical protein